MRRPTPNAIVGFAALFAFLILLMFTFMIKKTLLGPRTEVNVLFDQVSGLEVGSPVYVAGVHAGQVTRISYQPDNLGKPVLVTLSLSRQYKLYRNARIKIIQTGLIGDKRVEIDPGTMATTALPYGEAIEGEPQFDMDQSLRRGQEILSDLAASMRSVRTLLTDETNLEAIRNGLQALEKSLGNIDALLRESKEDVSETVANLRRATESANRLIDRADSFLGTTEHDLQEIRVAVTGGIQQLERETALLRADASRLTERFGRAADETTSLTAQLRVSIGPTLDSILRLGDETELILRRIREGRGTVGLLVNDPGPFLELERVLRGLRKTLIGGGDGLDARIPYEPRQPTDSSPASSAPSPSPTAR